MFSSLSQVCWKAYLNCFKAIFFKKTILNMTPSEAQSYEMELVALILNTAELVPTNQMEF